MVWYNNGPGASTGLHAQRISHDGELLWGLDGVRVPGQFSVYASAISDEHGGVLIASENVSGIGAQRLAPDGLAVWPESGVFISGEPRSRGIPAWVADGSGGGILAWYDRRGTSFDVYANRISADGNVVWQAGGIPVRVDRCDSSFMDYDVRRVAMTPDGHGGALMAWTDCRSHQDIYAQRVDSSGVIAWTPNGVPVCTDPGPWEMNPLAAPDGTGGAIIAWQDLRFAQWNLFAQRIDANGEPQWVENGIAIAPPARKLEPAMVQDGSAGVIVSWSDGHTGEWKRYAQRVSHDGSMLWGDTGVNVCGSAVEVYDGLIVTDGEHGAICTWLRPSGSSYSLWAQRVDGGGNLLWGFEGVVVADQTQPYSGSWAVLSDDAGGLISAWSQNGAADIDVFAQRTMLGGPPVAVATEPRKSNLTIRASPNPARAAVAFRVAAGSRTVHATILDTQGRRVRNLGPFTSTSAGLTIQWDGRDEAFHAVAPGIYLVQVSDGSWIRTLPFVMLD